MGDSESGRKSRRALGTGSVDAIDGPPEDRRRAGPMEPGRWGYGDRSEAGDRSGLGLSHPEGHGGRVGRQLALATATVYLPVPIG